MFRKNPQKPQNRPRQPANRQSRSGNYTYFSSSQDGMEKVARQPAERHTSKKKGGNLVKGLAILVVLLIVVYGTFLSSTPKIVIQNTSQTQPNIQNMAAYGSYAKSEIDKNFSNRNKITINTSAIATALKQKFPEIGNVSITVPIFGRQPVINIDLTGTALTLRESSGELYEVNSAGVIVGSTPTPVSGLPLVDDEAGLSVAIGTQSLPQSYISFIQLMNAQFLAKHLAVNSQKLNSDGELDVYPGGAKYFVKFNLNDNKNDKQQVGDYFALVNYLKQKGIYPSRYIDARIPGRVYYK